MRAAARDVKWAWLALGALTALFLALEWRFPYYFLQDDNRDSSLPFMVHNVRSLAGGELAQFNFHQFCGAPHLANGVAGVLYPPAYGAALASRLVWGHWFAAVDLLVIFHLLLGGLGTFLLLKAFTLPGRVACFGAITTQLTSFVIYASSSWLVVSGVPAYYPWMLFFGLRWLQSGQRGHLLGLVSTRLLLFYLGYPQYFLYAAVFEGLAWWGFCRGREAGANRVALLGYVGSWLATLLLATPLLLPMWSHLYVSAHRQQALPWAMFLEGHFGIREWLTGLLNPFSPRHYLQTPITDWMERSMPYLSHLGYATLGLIAVALYAFVGGTVRDERKKYFAVALGGSVVALLGSCNVLAPLLYVTPVFNRLRWPFKLQAFTAFYLVVLAAMGLGYLLETLRNRRAAGVIFGVVLTGTVANFGALYLGCSPKVFRTHLDRVPLEEPLRERLAQGRIFSLGYRFENLRTANALAFNYATLWDLYHFAGYDPMVPQANLRVSRGLEQVASFQGPPGQLPVEHLRRWGVKWYVVSNDAPQYGPALASWGMTVAHQDELRTVYVDPQAWPLLYWQQGGAADITYRLSANAVDIVAQNPQHDGLHVNILGHPYFTARLDDEPVPIRTGDHGQMVIDTPAGRHRIRLRYQDPWLAAGGWLAAGTLLGLAVWCGVRGLRWRT